MTHPLLLALGLLFFAVSFLVTGHVGRVAAIVVASILFLLATIVTAFGAPW
ncbi:MAG: hypothetical protein ACRDRC_01720 [Pseudonocardiaceae bacterium]